jgi:hypothetical protein
LVYSTYLGGSGGDQGYGIAVDSSGDAYVTGYTASTDFPTVSPLQANLAGEGNAFVAELNPSGSALVYSTYLGGSGSDSAMGIAVDSSGNAYLTGLTGSTDFPTTPSALQTTLGGTDITNAFVTKLNWSGAALSLVYSTYLGGNGGDGANGIAVDSSGNAYVTGYTASTNFPTAKPLQASLGGTGATNAFVAKLNWAASTSTLSLVYSTYLGGSIFDDATGIAVGSSGSAYVTGWTQSTDFPTTRGAFQTTLGAAGITNAFVAKLNWSGSALSLVYSTYLGGSGGDGATGIAVDSSGNACVTGGAGSTDFPTANPLQASLAGDENAFAAELNPSGSALVYSTYLGGSGEDEGEAIAVDSSGNTYVAGSASSADFPTSPGAFQATLRGADAFYNGLVAKISPANSPGVAFGPGALPAFGAQPVGTSSAPQSLTLTAAGSQPLVITSITVSANFALVTTSTSCPYSGGTVAAGATCTLDVTFTPTVTGMLTGSVTLTDNRNGVAGSTQAVRLTGAGVPVVSFSPGSLNFGIRLLSKTSASQTVTVSNSGTASIILTSISLAGANSSDFSQNNNCPVSPNTFAPGASCQINATFSPTVSGPRKSAVNVRDNSGDSLFIPLTGVGTAVSLSPASLSFPSQSVGSSGTPQTVTLSNSGSSPVNIWEMALWGANAADFSEGSTCGNTLAAGSNCGITVTFTPSAAGTRSASLLISDDGGGSPQSVSLSGVGAGASSDTSSVSAPRNRARPAGAPGP